MRTRKGNCGLVTGEGDGGPGARVDKAVSTTGGTAVSAFLPGTSAGFSDFGLSTEAGLSVDLILSEVIGALAASSCLAGTVDDAGLGDLFLTGAAGAEDAGAPDPEVAEVGGGV